MYTHNMANKTIYVSSKDEKVYEEAQQIAGEALSSVIARALTEYVARSKEKKAGMKEISIQVGAKGSEREQRFVGEQLGKWDGRSEDKTWLQSAKIYHTSKNNVAVLLTTTSKASLITNPREWKSSGAYLENKATSELIVADMPSQLEGKIPTDLLKTVQELFEKEEKKIEYLNI